MELKALHAISISTNRGRVDRLNNNNSFFPKICLVMLPKCSGKLGEGHSESCFYTINVHYSRTTKLWFETTRVCF